MTSPQKQAAKNLAKQLRSIEHLARATRPTGPECISMLSGYTASDIAADRNEIERHVARSAAARDELLALFENAPSHAVRYEAGMALTAPTLPLRRAEVEDAVAAWMSSLRRESLTAQDRVDLVHLRRRLPARQRRLAAVLVGESRGQIDWPPAVRIAAGIGALALTTLAVVHGEAAWSGLLAWSATSAARLGLSSAWASLFEVSVRLLAPMFVFGTTVALFLIAVPRREPTAAFPRCPACGNDMTGSQIWKCERCGALSCEGCQLAVSSALGWHSACPACEHTGQRWVATVRS